MALPGVQVLFAFLLVVPFNQGFAHVSPFQEHLVVAANRLALMGLGLLAIAMTAAIVLVTDVLFAAGTTIATGVVVFLLFALLWFALPIKRRLTAGG